MRQQVKQLIDLVIDHAEGDLQVALDALCDGEALGILGITDQTLVEDAHTIIADRLKNKTLLIGIKDSDDRLICLYWDSQILTIMDSYGNVIDAPSTIVDVDSAYKYLCLAYIDQTWDMQDFWA